MCIIIYTRIYYLYSPRVMRVEYDHYSKQCPSYPTPPIHPEDKGELIDRTRVKVETAQVSSR